MIATHRASRNAPTIDLTAVKYLRIVIASYILAVGIGVIGGFDVNAYFSAFLSHPTSLYVSRVFVVFCALMLIFGYFLRLVSLCLAIVILASSVQINMMLPNQGSIDAFWVDLVLVCGLLACYCPLSARQLRKQAVFKSDLTVRATTRANTHKVVPRRVSVTGTASPNVGNRAKVGQKLNQILLPSKQHDFLADRPINLPPLQREKSEDVINIFAYAPIDGLPQQAA